MASLARELEKNNRSTNEVYIQPYRDAVEELLEGRLVEEDDDCQQEDRSAHAAMPEAQEGDRQVALSLEKASLVQQVGAS